MLSTSAAFPLPGSFALFEQDGQTLPVRIMSVEDDAGLVGISVQGRQGSSAYKSAPLADLLDPTPLSTAEKAELKELHSYLLRVKWPQAAKKVRADALDMRLLRAPLLQQLLARIPLEDFPAARAAAAELKAVAA